MRGVVKAYTTLVYPPLSFFSCYVRFGLGIRNGALTFNDFAVLYFQMRESLKNIQERIPFSSFASTLFAAGDAVPMHLGRNCIGQARALAKELERKGYKPSFFINLARANDIHYAFLLKSSALYIYWIPSVGA